MGDTVETNVERIERLTAEMMEWVEGRRSWWNQHASSAGGDSQRLALATCAVVDAQEVVKLSAAIQALAALPAS
jgi:hypothetical protein